jgi:hypothetical protein
MAADRDMLVHPSKRPKRALLPKSKSAGGFEMIVQSMRSVLAGFAAMAFVSVAFAGSLPEVSTDGLHLIKQSEFSAVYVRPGAKLGGYTKVALLECFVAFAPGWEQNINEEEPMQLTPQNFQQIKTRLAAEFMKVFKAQLTAGGYPIVDDAAADVLVLRPAIVNLQISNPDPMAGPGASVSQSAGQMTLYLELYDSVTSALLARVIDAEAAGNTGGAFGFQTASSNLIAADDILKKWSDTLVKYLGQARAHN